MLRARPALFQLHPILRASEEEEEGDGERVEERSYPILSRPTDRQIDQPNPNDVTEIFFKG